MSITLFHSLFQLRQADTLDGIMEAICRFSLPLKRLREIFPSSEKFRRAI
jgi:hypothetical protein